MVEWVIERLQTKHDRSSCRCGKPALDTFLHSLVSQYEKRRLGRTYVATEPGQVCMAGYYTLAAGSFNVSCLAEKVRKKLPKHPLPTVHLGRLAVDQPFRGKGLGETLLFHALRSSLEISERLGAFAVDVRAIGDEARAFYQRYSFILLQDNPRHLYLPMQTVEAMFKP